MEEWKILLKSTEERLISFFWLKKLISFLLFAISNIKLKILIWKLLPNFIPQ